MLLRFSEVFYLMFDWFDRLLARFTRSVLDPFRSTFYQLVDIAEQLFNEYVIFEMRNEGSDGLHKLKEAIEQRETERRTRAMHEVSRIPEIGEKRNPKKSHKNALTKLPSPTAINKRMSDKLRRRLSNDSDSLMEVIGQKLLSLSVYHYLSELRKRQQNNDNAGDFELQKVRYTNRGVTDKSHYICII